MEEDGVHQREIIVVYTLASKIFATRLLSFKPTVSIFSEARNNEYSSRPFPYSLARKSDS